jgi:CRP-like cAMP-binding protein
MPSATQATVSNRLISALPPVARKRLLAACELVILNTGELLCEADASVTHAWFPQRGIIATVAIAAGHPPLDSGLIGNEGMLGATLSLNVSTSGLRAVVQASGSALRLPERALTGLLEDNPPLRRVLHRYVYVLMAQLAQVNLCVRFHQIEQRLARWLLMTHDRVHADHFQLTHQYLANMLGVQRSAITIAAGDLQRRKLIHYNRGRIELRSRAGLEAAACECYAAMLQDYAQRFGARGSGSAERRRGSVADSVIRSSSELSSGL